MTIMNQDQLRAIFHYLKVPASAYDLGNNTRLGACETIEHTSQGWEVYATERGSKCAVEIFSDETDACFNLLYRMTHYCYIDKKLPQLTIRKLHSILVYLKVPEELYDFSAGYFGTNCYSMEWTAQGWEVFFAVNGEKRDIAVFDNETDACLDLLYKVMHR